ncbi:NAD-dependent epimerase/dehydratase family protein [Nitratireductor indicus]|uniref:NAD-dependent epimerase/dehydratase family protein n=1 Tax=Nitratireductor indicus TaxID=721133 RepID=UPI002876A5F7|nr:NAD(P)-dependent oxidoreductase [Nitratireductor indicus]MDS1136248.1 NAD(P)-dependent oxidoreductase [Nitratireductor indicus]
MTSSFSQFDRSKPVLVIGGRGFVGSHIVRCLLGAGLKVHVFGPRMDVDLLGDLAGRFDESVGSVLDQDELRAAIAKGGCGAVVTNAAYASGAQGLMRSGDADAARAMEVNVEGFRRTLEAAYLEGVEHVIWSDSTVVYGPAALYGARRVDESDERRPTTFYGLTKVLGEDLAQYYRDRHGMNVVGLRMALLLGGDLWYRGAASAISGVISQARPGHAHSVQFHDERIDLMHVADIARSTLLALESPGPLAAHYNVNGFTASMSEIVAAVKAAVPGYDVVHDIIESPLTFPLISDAAFRRDTGYAPQYDLNAVIRELTGEARP